MCAHIHKRVYLSEFLCRSDRVTCACRYARLRVCLYRQAIYTSPSLHPIAFGVSCNLILQSQSNWSLFNGTWQKRRRELDNRLSFEVGEGIPPIPPMRFAVSLQARYVYCLQMYLFRQSMCTSPHHIHISICIFRSTYSYFKLYICHTSLGIGRYISVYILYYIRYTYSIGKVCVHMSLYTQNLYTSPHHIDISIRIFRFIYAYFILCMLHTTYCIGRYISNISYYMRYAYSIGKVSVLSTYVSL